jgi:hypothetical protein
MARAYITFREMNVQDGQLMVSAECEVLGAQDFGGVAVDMPFAGEPSANTIRSTVIAYLLAEAESATNLQLPQGQAVIMNGPV